MSIHKYPSKKAKNGYLYLVKVYMIRDGQRADHIKRGFRTRKEAKDYEARLIYLKASGKLEEFIKPSQKSYGEIFEEWYQAYQDTVEPTTASRTLDMFRLHILPVMGELPISKISPLECQNFITEKAKTFKNIKQIKSYTGKVFDFAIKMKLLKHNPMAEIIMPKRKKIRIENYWTVQELQEFLTIVLQEEPYKHYALFRLLAYSGLRKGELYALKWVDIDFQSETLSVSKSLGRIDGKAIEKGTKNDFSVRKIKLDSETISILQEWKGISQKEKAQLVVAPLSIEQDFIFTYCTRSGSIEPLHADYINNILSRIIRKHGLRKISPHGFRHTHATLMIEIGVDPVNTAKRLGHASSQMTLDTYSHSTTNGEDKSIKQFADYLKAK
ncbi:TPA: tyrosine-type recombinase/integrase [Streptococcus suis]|nr:site-specific integrase [Streptococcus suis]HEL1549981.1 tyrosine-type recombinase/integrase [Streptococcus suis]HEM3705126.1 tyrosine-type recombinase/integrase [Streptococcus suis]HEP1782011.1 tyrosine-type recombinase/integrase [Streptococcus suis]